MNTTLGSTCSYLCDDYYVFYISDQGVRAPDIRVRLRSQAQAAAHRGVTALVESEEAVRFLRDANAGAIAYLDLAAPFQRASEPKGGAVAEIQSVEASVDAERSR